MASPPDPRRRYRRRRAGRPRRRRGTPGCSPRRPTTCSRAQPRAVRRRHPRRRAAAGGRRRRLGQDPGAHPPHRPPHPRPGRQPLRDPGHHVHQQGRRRDEVAGRRPGRPGGREDVGVDVPLGVRAHPAARRRPARLPPPFTIYDQADANRLTGYVIRDLGLDTKRFPPRSMHAAISAAKNDGLDPEAYAGGAATSSSARSPRSSPSTSQARPLPGRLRWTSTTCSATVACCASTPTCCSTTSAGSSTSWSTSTRTRTGSRTTSSSCSPPRPQRLRSSATRTSRSTRFRGADMRNIVEFEDAFPDTTVVLLEQNYRSTQTILDAANAVIANNVGRKPKELWTDHGTGDPIVRYHADDEVDEAQWITREITRLHDRRVRGQHGDGRPALGRRRRLLPHQRPEPGAGRAAHAGRHPLQGGGRHPLLRPQGDQGRHRLPAGGRQPGRRGVDQAGPQRAQAGGRRHLDRPARRLRHRAACRSSTPCAAPTTPGWAAAPSGASRPSSPCSTTSPTWRRAAPARCSSSCSSARATSTSSRPSARSRPRAGSRTWPSWSARPARPRRSTSSSSRSAWWPTPTTSTTTPPR